MASAHIELERTAKGWLGQALVIRDGKPAYLAESIVPAPNILVRFMDGTEWFRTTTYQSRSGIRGVGQGGVTYRRADGTPVRLNHHGLLGFRLELCVGAKTYAWQTRGEAIYPWMVCSIPFVHGTFEAHVTDTDYLDVAIAVLYYAWCRSDTAD
jgi:hypothetical protein